MEQSDFAFLSAQPSTLQNGQLKKHQLVGLNWLISLYEVGVNGILADEMGLGKTIQTIAFLAYLYEYKGIRGHHMIVCPNSVLGNWLKEFKKWLPELRVVKLNARKEYRYDILNDYINSRNFDVVLVSYEGVSICRKELMRIDWKYIIVDEAHRLKNDESQLSKQLRNFNVDLKLLMTGTPLQNNLRELWALLNFILPDVFDDPELFETYAHTDKEVTQEEVEKHNMELITSLHRILRPFILKRTKEVLEQALPAKKEIHVYVGLTKTQIELYKSLLLKKKMNEEMKTIRNVLMQLRKCCNHPYLFEGIEEPGLPPLGEHLITTSGKMIVLDKLLTKLHGGHQVLIFSQFTTMLDILEDYLIYKGYKYCRIDGETFIDERERQLEEFVHPDSDHFVFLLSTRAGGLGVNLASADTVVLYDSDWNPQVDLQAMDRAHRIGQKNEVNVYRFIAENTVEEKIVERQKVKLKWDNLVILKGKLSQKQAHMDKQELRDLLQFGAKEIFKSETLEFKDEDIEELLRRGERKTQEVDERIGKYMNQNQERLLDLGFKCTNIYEFEGDDYQKKKQLDKEILDKAFQESIEMMKYKKRAGKYDKQEEKVYKRITLPDYHFYENKERLEELMSMQLNDEKLSEAEEAEKERLRATALVDWNKNDYNSFLRALEKYDSKDVAAIAKHVKREPEEIAKYLGVFLARMQELGDYEKIKTNIERGELQRSQKKVDQRLVNLKCKGVKHFAHLNFEPCVYNKVKSKLYTLQHDKFIIYQCHLHGCHSYKLVKANLTREPLFRFDFYIKHIKDVMLNKRIKSLMRMLANENEYLESDKYKQQQREIKEKKERQKVHAQKATKQVVNDVEIVESKNGTQKQPYLGINNLVSANADEHAEVAENGKDNSGTKATNGVVSKERLKQTDIIECFSNSKTK